MSTPRPSLRDSLADYLNSRRALGFQLANAGRLLEQFVGYLERHGIDTVTTEHAVRWRRCWSMHPDTGWRSGSAWCAALPSTCQHRLLGRGRAGRSDPPRRVGPRRTCTRSPRSDRSSRRRAGCAQAAAATYQSLISLLAISGIRIGEAIALDDDDFDVEHEVLVLHHTKFNKQRLVPLHPSATLALSRYVDLRQRLLPRPASPALFVSTAGTRLLHSNISLTFAGLVERVGLTRRSAVCRPVNS